MDDERGTTLELAPPTTARLRHFWVGSINSPPPVGSPALCGTRVPGRPLGPDSEIGPDRCVVCIDVARAMGLL